MKSPYKWQQHYAIVINDFNIVEVMWFPYGPAKEEIESGNYFRSHELAEIVADNIRELFKNAKHE
jgi:hypothetical protein